MYDFFNMMKKVADTDSTTYDNIAELTFKIKEEKEGSGKWNDTLVAKWLTYYRAFFIGKLKSYDRIDSLHVDIIVDSFRAVVRKIDPERAFGGGTVTGMLNVVVQNNIREALSKHVGVNVLNNMRNSDRSKRAHARNSFNNSLEHFSSMGDSFEKALGSCEMDSVGLISELKYLLKDNTFGSRVVDALAFSGGKFATTCLNSYIKLTDVESTNKAQSLKCIRDAYRDIIKYIDKNVCNRFDTKKALAGGFRLGRDTQKDI